MKKIHTQYIKKIYRELGDYLSPYFKKIGISANQITLSRIVFVLFGSILILNDDILSKIITLFFFIIFSLFDAADGSLARITKKSLFGMWLDTVIDRFGLLIIFTFFGIKLVTIDNHEIVFVIINFLILILYLIKFSFLSDVSCKEKYLEFRNFNKYLGVINNLHKEQPNEIDKYCYDYLKRNFNLKNLCKFIYHQFSPHTANLILYMGLINLLNYYKIGLTALLFFYLIWIILDIYKITLISIKLDKKNYKND
jgi:phosphatidylglycerophosphate synthase